MDMTKTFIIGDLDDADARQLTNDLVAAMVAVRPDDNAWAAVAPHLAREWVKGQMDYQTRYGHERGNPKGRQERHGDAERLGLVLRIIDDWPDRPLGIGYHGIGNWFRQAAWDAGFFMFEGAPR